MLSARRVARRIEHHAPGQTTVVVFCLVWRCGGVMPNILCGLKPGGRRCAVGGCTLVQRVPYQPPLTEKGDACNRERSDTVLPLRSLRSRGGREEGQGDDRDGRGVESGRFR